MARITSGCAGTPERLEFETGFKRDMSALAGVAEARVVVLTVLAGSSVVRALSARVE